MPKAGKGKLKIICAQCDQEKFAKEFCSNKAKTCTDCNTQPRTCGGCHHTKPAKDFAKVWSRHCQACNSDKETAEHVDVCESEGCDTVFARNPDSFTWKKRGDKGNWESKCKQCYAPKPKTEAIRCTGGCDELKPPEEFNHGTTCKSCRSERTRQERIRQGERVTKETAPKPTCCSKPGCGKLFSEAEWGYDSGGGRWKSWCKGCHNDAGYDIAYRQRELVRDPEGYRAHTAGVLRLWRARNADKQAAQQLRNKRSTKLVYNRWVTQAERRGLTVNEDEHEDLETMFLQPCFYCGYDPPAEAPLNTLDRIDSSSQQYNLGTCVTCCVPCNLIKGKRPLQTFLDEAHAAAFSGTARNSVERTAIDAAYRSLGHHDRSHHATHLYRHEQLCFISAHQS